MERHGCSGGDNLLTLSGALESGLHVFGQPFFFTQYNTTECHNSHSSLPKIYATHETNKETNNAEEVPSIT